MEILRGKINTINYVLPDPTAVVSSATWHLNGQSGLLSVGNATDGVVAITLPYTQYDGTLALTLSISGLGPTVINETLYYDIVTPLLGDLEVYKILDNADEDYTLEDVRGFERSVRHIIQAHTGQAFGKASKTLAVSASGTNVFKLPERLISASRVNGANYDTGWYSVTGGGWYLEAVNRYGVPPIKADYYGINEVTESVMSPVPISTPPFFPENSKIYVTGVWGWEAVPEAVREAARLLLNDYATDSVYRDSYLTSVTAADWRIQFNSGAFARTGNVRADQLLAPYVLMRGWAVI